MSLRSLQEVSGSARMALLSWSYKTMRYLLPRKEVTGKLPVSEHDNTFSAGPWNIDAVTMIVVRGRSEIPTVDTVGRPGVTISGCFVDNNAGTGGC